MSSTTRSAGSGQRGPRQDEPNPFPGAQPLAVGEQRHRKVLEARTGESQLVEHRADNGLGQVAAEGEIVPERAVEQRRGGLTTASTPARRWTVPDTARRQPMRVCARVVLPTPDGPVTRSRSPGSRVRVIGSARASVTRDRASRSGPVAASGEVVAWRRIGVGDGRVIASVELHAETADEAEELARDEYGDERAVERDRAPQQTEPHHHGHEADRYAAQELGDQ